MVTADRKSSTPDRAFAVGRNLGSFPDVLLVLVIALGFLWAFRDAAPGAPFVYDESDYMTLARANFWINYAEPQSQSLISFINLGVKALHGQVSRAGLSDYIRETHDTAFYRHYHGPLYYDWLCFVNTLAGGNESGVRYSGLVFHLLTFGTIVLGIPWAFGPEYRMGGWLGGALYLFSLNNILTATELSAHVIFMWLSLLGLILIARFANFPAVRTYYVALAGCAVSLCALEYGVLLFGCLGLALLLRRKQLFCATGSIGRLALTSAGLVAAIILVLWPAGLLKGTLVEGFLFIAYLTKFRKGSFGTVSPLQVWRWRLQGDTAECVVLLVCLAVIAILIWRSPRRDALLAVFLYPALMLLTTLKNTAANPRYFSSILAPVVVTASVLLVERVRIPRPAFAAAAAAIATLLAILVWHPVMMNGAGGDPLLTAVIDTVKREPAHTVVVPNVLRPSITYYFPGRVVKAVPAGIEGDAVLNAVRQANPDMACLYGGQALPGRVAARIRTNEGELICALRN